MRTKTQPKAVFRRNTRTVANAQKSIREDNQIDGAAKELILSFVSYLALDNLKPTTVISYAVTLRRLAKMCPPKGFLYLERSDIREVLLSLQQRGFAATTLHLFKARFMRFQRWLREEHGYPQDYPAPLLAGKKLDPGEKPVEFRGIKSSNKYRLRYGPEDLPTQKDVDSMVDVAVGARNRALVSVLYESAARLSEFMGLKMRSVERTPYGWKIHVDGKTGRRPIMLVNSGPYLAAWLQLHPFRNDPEAPVWISTGTRGNARTRFERTGELVSMDPNSVRAVLEDLGKRAAVRKKLNPHAFRHARATELARHLKESELRAYMGWTPGSAMPGIYVHLSGRDTDMAILAAHGIDAPAAGRALSHPMKCPACDEMNPSDAKICLRCKQPLDVGTSMLTDEAYRKLGNVLPAIMADQRAMRDLRRLLHKHKIVPQEATIEPMSLLQG